MNTAALITFAAYLLAMLAIGVVAYRLTANLSDYILGGRRLGGAVAALSAGASDMSGWLLLGLPGALYVSGMSNIWIAVGLAVGAWLNWQFVAKRLRIFTELAGDSLTLPDYLENRFRDGSRLLRIVSAAVILLFFTIYTSSGLVGGAVLFEKSFGLPYQTALLVGAVIIVSYTFLGGFLAVSWTDFFQGILMLIALIAVPIMTISRVGGWSAVVEKVRETNPAAIDAMTGATVLGTISLLAWGLGYFGQPHILARFMAVKSADEIPKARFIGMSWMVVALYGAIFTGFAGAAYFSGRPLENSETVFIVLTQELFNPWIAGILLAAILSAIMSTIDSQLLVCSSAITEDFYKGFINPDASDRTLVMVGRIAVVGIAILAVVIAGDPESKVLELVSYAWAGFGASFGPVIILSLLWERMNRAGAIAGIVTGALTVVIWGRLSGGIFDLYEMVPGFLLCGIAVIAASLATAPPNEDATAPFRGETLPPLR